MRWLERSGGVEVERAMMTALEYRTRMYGRGERCYDYGLMPYHTRQRGAFNRGRDSRELYGRNKS